MNTQIICFKCDNKIPKGVVKDIFRTLNKHGAKELEMGFIGVLPKC